MYTPCIRYTLDPNRLPHFKTYVEHELEAILLLRLTVELARELDSSGAIEA
jgi:hypothetical protein